MKTFISTNKSKYSKEIAEFLSENRHCTYNGFCYKNDDFDWDNGDPDEIIYVPESGFEFSEDCYDGIIPDVYSCYTKNDFIRISGHEAEDLFLSVDWQYPESLYAEWENDELENNN